MVATDSLNAITRSEATVSGAAVYRFDVGALGYGENWNRVRSPKVIAAWWRRFCRSNNPAGGRVVHVEDHRAIQISADEIPAQAREAIGPLLESFLSLGFTEPRFTKHADPFNDLEIVTTQAVQPDAGTVLRITRTRHCSALLAPELATVLLSVFPDGSSLVTTDARPKLGSPRGEKRQIRVAATPEELWSAHTATLAASSLLAKHTENPEAGFELINETDASAARFHLSRGVYAKRSLIECAIDEARLSGVAEEINDMPLRRGHASGLQGALVGFAWVVAVLAFMATVCFAAIGGNAGTDPKPPQNSAGQRLLAQSGELKAQSRLVRSATPNLREAE